jgi:hypothetical protein
MSIFLHGRNSTRGLSEAWANRSGRGMGQGIGIALERHYRPYELAEMGIER